MGVGTLEEIVDDNHAIVSSLVGPRLYVTICSFVDKDQIEPGCQVLLHHKVRKKIHNNYHLQKIPDSNLCIANANILFYFIFSSRYLLLLVCCKMKLTLL
jgi:hypothetical protein